MIKRRLYRLPEIEIDIPMPPVMPPKNELADRYLFIIKCDEMLSKEHVDRIQREVKRQIDNGIILKDKSIRSIVVINKETGEMREI